MRYISRQKRAELQRDAQAIRQRGQLAGRGVQQIAADILHELEDLRPLEAWRLAYGWTRPQVIAGIAALFEDDGLAAPPINSAMLCRWEHGAVPPSVEYRDALSRLYRLPPAELGLQRRNGFSDAETVGDGWYRRAQTVNVPSNGNNGAVALAAIRESIQLSIEVEGPAGGPRTCEHIEQAIAYYALHYARFSPGTLAVEVHRCRALVADMLTHPHAEAQRRELRRHAGWLSALGGNLAFHCADHIAALIHLGTAARLATDVGDSKLMSWSLGAQSMVARAKQRHQEALDLARQGTAHATSPLQRAQLLSWAELPALAQVGSRTDITHTANAAQREFDADPDGEQPGRFGFDSAELELHLAETHLVLNHNAKAATHARRSLSHTTTGRPGWAAATLAIAASEANRGRPDEAAELALAVLDIIPPPALRDTSRKRLKRLDQTLASFSAPQARVLDFRDRLRALPPLDAASAPGDTGAS
jgi:hypothetical protein